MSDSENLSKIAFAWHDIVDAQASAHSRPLALTSNTLTIGTCSSAWSEQLQFCTDHILRGIEKHSPDSRITKIVFRSGGYPSDSTAEDV